MTKLKQIEMIPSYVNEPTDDPGLFRVVDRKGDWTHYYHEKTKRYLPAVNHIIGLGFPKGIGLIEWFKKMTKEEIEQRLHSAGEKGARVHDAIRQLIDGQTVTITQQFKDEAGVYQPLTFEEWDCLMAFAGWAEMFKPTVSSHEAALVNLQVGYAGTTDFRGRIIIPKGIKLCINDRYLTVQKEMDISVLLDWKSGGSYDDHKLQVASYDFCYPTQSDFTGIVRVGTTHKSGYELKLWDAAHTRDNFNQFLLAKETYHFLYGNKTWEPPIKQIPTALAVHIPMRETPAQKTAKKKLKAVKKKIGKPINQSINKPKRAESNKKNGI